MLPEKLFSELKSSSKIGGVPNWIQNDETPICKFCNLKMDFYAQIDSSVKEHSEYNILDSSKIYIFICPKCYNVKAILQTY